MTTYRVTFESEDGIDIVSWTCPITAVHHIEKARAAGETVTIEGGDPFAALAAIFAAETADENA